MVEAALRWGVVVLVLGHGLIHLLGAGKGLGWFQVPQLRQPSTPLAGAAWLAAAVLLVVTALMIAWDAPTWWWAVGLTAAVVSQLLIISAWHDAKAGTIANIVVVLASLYGFATLGPGSYQAEWKQRSVEALAQAPATRGEVTEADLAGLPAPVARYLRRAGAVGKPTVTTFYAEIHGRIRSAPDEAWMPFTGKQVNTYGPDPQRLFFIQAKKSGVPVEVLHVYSHADATMRGKLLSLVPILDASGPQMNRSETVTVFNDLAVFAPGALIDSPVSWTPINDRKARATFTNGPESVTAELTFDETGDLVDFQSDDRFRASGDGKSFTPLRWHTPLTSYRDFSGRRVPVAGDGMWLAPGPEGHFSYIEFHVDHIAYDVRHPEA